MSDDPNFTNYVTLEEMPEDKQAYKLVGEVCSPLFRETRVYSLVQGEWEGHTAGGCLNYATWRNNPQFKLDIGAKTEVTIFLTCTETARVRRDV